MDVEKLTMDKDQARQLYLTYQQHRAGMTKDDQAIASIYKRIAAGKLIIRALASIAAAGLYADGLPRLAICRADFKKCQARMERDTARFCAIDRWGRTGRTAERNIAVTIPGAAWGTKPRVADVPLIPVHLRPRKAIDKYFVLWEAEWYSYPVDPYLLRRIGIDAWLVVASWDLTEVERAVMSTRLNA